MSGTGKEFMGRTRFQYLGRSDQSLGYPQPSLQLGGKGDYPIVDLPEPGKIPVDVTDLRKAIERRTSVRSYSQKPLSLDELSYLLWCTQGVKEVAGSSATFRTVPSAGARHALETYILVNNVEGLEKGLYHFLAIGHKLEKVNTSVHIASRVRAACLNQSFVETSAVTFIWSAVAYRMKWRYGERGYRYMHLDAGHVCQNLYLSAESIDCGACAIAAFQDEEINSVLGIDGEEEFVIYVATVGKK
ncbi:MAG: SagB/ThcOx family dehydrogenase [Methanolobus sp.]|uniref:SagB/ThcOx family dehydrogenase n=1 Tax=Methanolobus sp. TaxID=1874737 RepID=UPI0027318F02|nr:SagB/ThcOx family dehydrogenase [Methanolobus sp.]MDP2218432.1 SagB/ThcOx family dehydrogenase [Methanolobus sp.]